METTLTVPQELTLSFQRLLPHMTVSLRNDQHSLEAVLLYLKLGGEKLARVAIDAYNQTHRLKNAQLQKLRLEEALMAEQLDEAEDDDNEKELDENEDSDDDDPDY